MTPASPGRPRVVFDCNTFIQAIAYDDGPAADCLRLVELRHVELFVSRPVLAELRRVLAYDEVIAISPSFTPDRISAFLRRLQYHATFLRNVRRVMEFPRDPNDEPYINLAAAARVDFLVTRDKDLLSLPAGHSQTAKQFRPLTHPLNVVSPTAFLSAVTRSQA